MRGKNEIVMPRLAARRLMGMGRGGKVRAVLGRLEPEAVSLYRLEGADVGAGL